MIRLDSLFMQCTHCNKWTSEWIGLGHLTDIVMQQFKWCHELSSLALKASTLKFPQCQWFVGAWALQTTNGDENFYWKKYTGKASAI